MSIIIIVNLILKMSALQKESEAGKKREEIEKETGIKYYLLLDK